jgi:hypothetical protein
MIVEETVIVVEVMVVGEGEGDRVGVRTRAKSVRLPSVLSSALRMGSANAAVLPDPVSAIPIMSRPTRYPITSSQMLCESQWSVSS